MSCSKLINSKTIHPFCLTKLNFKKLIIATLANQSRTIANMLDLDKNYAWPVEDRSRFIYEIKCNNLKNENISGK